MIGKTIAHYRILSKLGAGGMGEVYLAEDDRLGRRIALKVLPETYTQDTDRLRRFEQEARAASALNHPNILTVHEIGKFEGLQYIATEYVEGQTLRQRLAGGPLSANEAVNIVTQCANALQAAHAAGITHRDLKPENIMLRPDGYLKLLDFGLAKLMELPSGSSSASTGQDEPTRSLFETQPGMVIGTLAYMSPEQARGQRADGRSDLFSLGIIFYEMVTGRRPFAGETPSDMIASLLVSEPARPASLQPNLPPELDAILTRLLAKDRDARFQTAQELLQELKPLRARLEFASESGETAMLPGPATTRASQISYETNVTPTPAPAAPIRSRRSLLIGGLALLLLIATGAAAWFLLRPDGKIDSVAVLPFVNDTQDPEVEYLSEGITEGLINSLSTLPDLGVSSRNAVIRYRGREVDAQVVGRELDVKAVLVGHIARRGDELNINAELVEVRNGRQIWGEKFTRPVGDLMTLQNDLAWKILDRLRVRLSPSQKDAMADLGTSNPEAYTLYLKGRYYWNQGTPEAIRKADENFEAAAGKDPTYAEAVTGCAASHATGYEGDSPDECMVKAKVAALGALKVNRNLVDAHLTLARVNLRYDWDFAAAERALQRAIEIEPKNALAHQQYAEFLALMGRRQEAEDALARARRLDAHSLPINQTFGMLAYYANQYPQAIERLQQVLTLDANYVPAHQSLGLAYEQAGQSQEAVLEFLRARNLLTRDQAAVTALKQAFAEKGLSGFWLAALEMDEKQRATRYVPASSLAATHLRLGQENLALAELEKGLREKDGGLVELKVDPVYRPLHNNPRFQTVLQKVGLTPER